MTTRNVLRTGFALALVALVAAGLAFAGGPIYIFDYENRIPYVWHMDTWPNGAVPYYTDLGNLGRIGNARAGVLVDSAWAEWNNVPTSTFLAAKGGTFANLGLPDIVCPSSSNCNAGLVIGAWNGGGVHVIYDNDGKILQNFLGIYGALGVSTIEFVADGTNEMLEGWTILNGPSVQSSDPNGDRFRGVITHEFGHEVNLAHSQVNGAIYTYYDATGPLGCNAPYSGTPTGDQIETMYPYTNLGTSGSGMGIATVDRMDDIAAISDLYPAPGWPEAYGTIRGNIYQMLNIRGNGSGDTSPVTGVNVIARNLADPFNDFTSYLSGQVSKGQAGADGSFEMHGLTPGATYVLYVDNLRNGAFSVPRMLVLPGPEEFYNGVNESGNGETDDRCAYTGITAAAGQVTTADITFNRVKGAPQFIPQPATGTPTDITPDGSIVVGTLPNYQAFKWTLADNNLASLGGYGNGGQVAISDDGTKVGYSMKNASNVIQPAVYENGAWSLVPLPPNAVSPCSGGWGSTYDMSGDGSTVVGLMYTNGCATAGALAFYSKNGVSQTLPKSPDALTRALRANAVNYDGTVVVGWSDATSGLRRGAYWNVGLDGVSGPVHVIQTDPTKFAGEALDVTRDGSTIIGLNAWNVSTDPTVAWHYSQSGGLEFYPNLENAAKGAAGCISDDGQIVGGWSDMPNPSGFGTYRVPTIYTPALGWFDLNAFLNAQGTYAQDITIANPMAMSADGRTIVGWAGSIFGNVGWALQMPKAVMCHVQPGHLAAGPHTIDVSFPDGLTDHLAHGDTIGMCEHGGL